MSEFSEWVERTSAALEMTEADEPAAFGALVEDYERLSEKAILELPAVADSDPEAGFGLWCRLTGAGAQAMAVLIGDAILARAEGLKEKAAAFDALGQRVQRAAVRIAEVAVSSVLARRIGAKRRG